MERSTEQPFTNKTVLVTGSGRGIGRAIALHFASLGADVVVNYFRNRISAEQTAAEISHLGRKSLVLKAHVGEIAAIKQMFDTIDEHFGGLDILVNNAASGYNRSVMEQKEKGWDWTMNINARAALFCSQHAVPLMVKRGGGCIVNISSPGSNRVLPDYVVVGASKAALESLTRYLAVELAPYKIVVNAVSPGIVATQALEHFSVMQDPGHIERAAAATPAGRLTSLEDVAGVVAFLCSPAAEMIRGQILLVDGGFSLPYSHSERIER
jgi:enoyl-[acyl-carrier protein] reductase III